MRNKLNSYRLPKIELIFGAIYFTLSITLGYFHKFGLLSLVSSLMIIAFIVVMIKMKEKHVYYKDNHLMFILSLFYKVYALIAVIFIISGYPMRDIISFILIVLVIFYMILAYLNKKQYIEILNAYIYMQVVIFVFFAFR